MSTARERGRLRPTQPARSFGPEWVIQVQQMYCFFFFFLILRLHSYLRRAPFLMFIVSTAA